MKREGRRIEAGRTMARVFSATEHMLVAYISKRIASRHIFVD